MLLDRFIKEELNMRTDDYISALISLLENEAENAVFIAEKEDETN